MRTSSEKPNILLITTDQQRFDTINALGNDCIYTPHLNWLADEGVTFTHCYSDAPMCIPARATIMTGKSGYRNNLTYNSASFHPINSQTSLPALLTQSGYQTRAQGKMHFEPFRVRYGFEHMELLEDYYRYMARHPHLGVPADHGLGQNEMEPGISTVHESQSLTHWIVERAIDFLETRDPSRPFFLWTGFSKPHPPLDPCANYWMLYQHKQVPDPVFGDWSRALETVPEGLKYSTYTINGADRFSPEMIADIRRAYYACITQIDYNLGRLFSRMRELGVIRNTLVIFTSDHGDLLGDHHLAAKTLFLEGSAHVPLIMRLPDRYDPRRGTTCDALTTLADIFPTCLNYAGTPVPEQETIDGYDFFEVLEGTTRRTEFVGVCGENFAILKDGYKFMYCAKGAAELMFNMEQDTYEQKNLADVPEVGAIKQQLRELLIEKVQSVQPGLLDHGNLPTQPVGDPLQMRGENPGYHSRELSGDVCH